MKSLIKKKPPLTMPPNTTEQEDITTAGQRRVNLIWEFTQAFIAIFSTLAVMSLGGFLAIKGRIEDFPPFLALSYGLVIGCYFQRTNHVAIGGIGKKPDMQKYEGR